MNLGFLSVLSFSPMKQHQNGVKMSNDEQPVESDSNNNLNEAQSGKLQFLSTLYDPIHVVVPLVYGFTRYSRLCSVKFRFLLS